MSEVDSAMDFKLNEVDTNARFELLQLDPDRKKRKLGSDERLNRNRERNRIHARRTRERKRSQSMALQCRLNELQVEDRLLRQLIDETYTVSGLLGLAHSSSDKSRNVPSVEQDDSSVIDRCCQHMDSNINDSEDRDNISESNKCNFRTDSIDNCNKSCDDERGTIGRFHVPSSSVCRDDCTEVYAASNNSNCEELIMINPSQSLLALSKEQPSVLAKRVRRSGKFSQQERDVIRRERNRIHAKKTRDRKKVFQELRVKAITELEEEAVVMRKYLHSHNVISDEELQKYEQRDALSRCTLRKIAQQELSSTCYDNNNHNNSSNHSNNSRYQQEDTKEEDQDQEETIDIEFSKSMSLRFSNQDGDLDRLSEEGGLTTTGCSSGGSSSRTTGSSSSIFLNYGLGNMPMLQYNSCHSSTTDSGDNSPILKKTASDKNYRAANYN